MSLVLGMFIVALHVNISFGSEFGIDRCATVAFLQELEEADLNVKRKFAFLRQEGQAIDATERACTENLLHTLRKIHKAVTAAFDPTPTRDQLSPKALTLIDIINKHEFAPEDFCGIVFTQRRAVACVLSKLLNKWEGLKFVKASFLVGHGVGRAVDAVTRMKVKEQRDTVSWFQCLQFVWLFSECSNSGAKVRQRGVKPIGCDQGSRLCFVQCISPY